MKGTINSLAARMQQVRGQALPVPQELGKIAPQRSGVAQSLSLQQQVLAGAVAGAATTVVTNPMEDLRLICGQHRKRKTRRHTRWPTVFGVLVFCCTKVCTNSASRLAHPRRPCHSEDVLETGMESDVGLHDLYPSRTAGFC